MKISQDIPKSVFCFDWGARYIGVAYSPDRKHVFDRQALTVDSEGEGVEAIEKIIHQEKASEVVFGLPLALSGQEGRMAQRVRLIAKKVQQRAGCKVFFQDERLSSRGARMVTVSQKDHSKEHSIAAVHILETFLRV